MVKNIIRKQKIEQHKPHFCGDEFESSERVRNTYYTSDIRRVNVVKYGDKSWEGGIVITITEHSHGH